MEKVTLEQVHLKVSVAKDKSMPQQVYPWKTVAHKQGSTWSRYTHKGLQSVSKSKPEQGQGEEFTAT